MKNLLSENMLRFGTKNLSESQQKELVVKSIMETINQHGLTNVIRRKLDEQNVTGQSGIAVPAGQQQKATGAGQQVQGIALKIVGLLIKAMAGFTMSSGVTDEQGILKAVYMIKNKDIYSAVLREVQRGAAVKKEYGKNYPTIGSWISTDLTAPSANSFRDAMSNDTNIVYEINRHLRQFNPKESVAAEKGLSGTSSDARDYRAD
jgi:hypothetical protein